VLKGNRIKLIFVLILISLVIDFSLLRFKSKFAFALNLNIWIVTGALEVKTGQHQFLLNYKNYRKVIRRVFIFIECYSL
jgi:hypothetical protein